MQEEEDLKFLNQFEDKRYILKKCKVNPKSKDDYGTTIFQKLGTHGEPTNQAIWVSKNDSIHHNKLINDEVPFAQRVLKLNSKGKPICAWEIFL